MNMTPKAIKTEVTRAIARDPGLSDAITLALGFRPRWSKLDLLGYLLVWLAYRSLTVSDPEQRAYNALLALGQLTEVQVAYILEGHFRMEGARPLPTTNEKEDDLLKALESIATLASCAPNDDEEAADKELTKIMNLAQLAIKRAKESANEHKQE